MDRETKKYGPKCMEDKDQQNCRPPPLAKSLLKDGGTKWFYSKGAQNQNLTTFLLQSQLQAKWFSDAL